MNNLTRQTARFVYTYDLPYATRKCICDLLDADQSWQTLGGQYLSLDATQLTLIGQFYMRHGSPTEELLKKFDAANTRIDILCHYVQQMNHYRALEILKPFTYLAQGDAMADSSKARGTLDTPTPSFASDNHAPPAIMDVSSSSNQFPSPMGNEEQFPAYGDILVGQQQQQTNIQQPCHKQQEASERQSLDIGEEIVRKACASNRKRTSISDQEVVNQLRLIMQITYNELKQASQDFSDSNILGNGGFASVYRGHWKGTDVAIKRLKCNLMDQALNELTILNSYRIDNILPIYGISIDGPEACLVYQFMSNGSLEDRLSCKKGTPALTWTQRALIGEGVAKGLFYLHTLRDKPLVHGDVKSANVLLDSQFVPKLGDFGLARQVFRGKNLQTEQCTHCTVSSVHGTSVYLPPEYLRHKILSPAVDVYSYGIVLLEMATGRRAYDGKRLLIDIVEDKTKSMSQGQICYTLKDSRLADDSQNDLKIWYELLIKLGLNCANKIKKKRLDMGQVLDCFANFKNNASQNNTTDHHHQSLVNHQNKSALSSNNSMARTLTPNLTAFTDTHHREQPQYQQQLLINKTPLVINNNSSLMMVEEEEISQVVAGDKSNQMCAVENILPLLTELGVKSGKEE